MEKRNFRPRTGYDSKENKTGIEGHLSAVRAVGRRDCPGTERQFPQPDVAIPEPGREQPARGREGG